MRSEVAGRLVAGIAAQHDAAIAACFAEDAELTALTPNGLRERSGRHEAGALIASWFGDATVLQVDAADDAEIADRLHIRYRFTGVENGEPFVVEQQLYCDLRDGLIGRAQLLCSGFQAPTVDGSV
jgi:hypothetical protein